MRHFPLQLKLNTDESPNVATEYGIRSIPTVMIFKNGQKMDAVIGAFWRAGLLRWLGGQESLRRCGQ